MMYGLNFGAQPLESFPAKKRLPLTMKDGPEKYRLVGIATTAAERDRMIEVANNGKRVVRYSWKRVRGFPGLDVVFAIYVN